MVRLITGVDKQEFVNLIYPNGVVAGLFNTMVSVTDRKGFIYGTEGHIEVENINNYEEFRIYNNQYELTAVSYTHLTLPPARAAHRL